MLVMVTVMIDGDDNYDYYHGGDDGDPAAPARLAPWPPDDDDDGDGDGDGDDDDDDDDDDYEPWRAVQIEGRRHMENDGSSH